MSLLPRASRRINTLIDQHPRILLGLLVLFGLALNLAVLAIRPPLLPNGDYQVGQTYRWWPLSISLATGNGYELCTRSFFPFCGPGNQVTASLEPAPALFFAGVARIANQSLYAAIAVQVGINLAILLLTYQLTQSIAGTRPALLAAFLWVSYFPTLKLISQISGDLLGTFFFSLSLILFLRARQTRQWSDWILTGLGLGLAILSRSALLGVVPALAAGLLIESWRTDRIRGLAKNLLPVVLIGLAVTGLLLPWFIRNQNTFGRLVPGTSLTGYVLYRQNYMLPEKNFLRVVGSAEAEQAVAELVARHPELNPSTNEVEMDQVYRREAIDIISANPVRYMALSLYRFLPLWFNWQVSEAYGENTPLVSYLLMLEQAVLLVLTLYAIRKNWQTTWPYWVSIGVVVAAYMGVNAQVRYLLPITPSILALAMQGLQILIPSLKTPQNRGSVPE